MKTYIILLSIKDYNRNENADVIEGEKFNSMQDLRTRLTRDAESSEFKIMDLSAFKEYFNDQELDPDNWWITYVCIRIITPRVIRKFSKII